VLTGRKPIVTSHFPSHPPSYPSVCIDAFNHASQKHISDPSTSTRGSLDPVIWVNTLNKTGMGGAGICHIQREGLRFLVPVGQEGASLPYVERGELMVVNPLFAFSFLESFLETLQDYLGDVTETAIKDNFDIVYMVRQNLFNRREGGKTLINSW
jgi:AP-3 complex subunit mu